jgi:hypothetical protein
MNSAGKGRRLHRQVPRGVESPRTRVMADGRPTVPRRPAGHLAAIHRMSPMTVRSLSTGPCPTSRRPGLRGQPRRLAGLFKPHRTSLRARPLPHHRRPIREAATFGVPTVRRAFPVKPHQTSLRARLLPHHRRRVREAGMSGVLKMGRALPGVATQALDSHCLHSMRRLHTAPCHPAVALVRVFSRPFPTCPPTVNSASPRARLSATC